MSTKKAGKNRAWRLTFQHNRRRASFLPWRGVPQAKHGHSFISCGRAQRLCFVVRRFGNTLTNLFSNYANFYIF
jgi:hypothetical protein